MRRSFLSSSESSFNVATGRRGAISTCPGQIGFKFTNARLNLVEFQKQVEATIDRLKERDDEWMDRDVDGWLDTLVQIHRR